MNIKEIFTFKNIFLSIMLENDKVNSIPEGDDNSGLIDDENMLNDLQSEWNQEYKLIYLSYVLDE